MLEGISFAYPKLLYLLILVAMLLGWYVWRQASFKPTLKISGSFLTDEAFKNWKVILRHLPFALRMLALILMIIALARPQSSSERQDVTIEGIDIVMALDISSSMLARDLKPDRLEAAKNVAGNFILNRPNDRIGLVVFSGESFTQIPLTTDHSLVHTLFKSLKSGMIEDGTAIGDGLGTAVSRLKDSKAISKVIILLTDGVNNSGSLDPLSAAEIARLYGIRVYTIGVGSRGMAPYPVQTPYGGTQMRNMEVQIDEELLKEIAKMTDGKYFRATNNEQLKDTYREIDELEKSKIDVTEFRKKHEEFLPLALLALGLLALEFFLQTFVFRSTP